MQVLGVKRGKKKKKSGGDKKKLVGIELTDKNIFLL